MVALPAIKFVMLGVRQLTRPAVRRIVGRATTKRGITYSMCIGLGRVSLGLSGVIAEWSRTEESKRTASKQKLEEEQRQSTAEGASKAAQKAVEEALKRGVEEAVATSGSKGKSPITKAETEQLMGNALRVATGGKKEENGESSSKGSSSSTDATAANAKSGEAKTPSGEAGKDEAEDRQHVVNIPSIVTPRSRSLLTTLTYGPLPKEQDTYDASVFVDPKRTAGEAARVFILHPYRSTWFVFRHTFLAPFPEKRLVDAGAELLIELLAYTVLACILFVELRQQYRSAAAKEAHMQARLEAIELKVNELVRSSSGAHERRVAELPPAPHLEITGRLHSLWHVASVGYRAVEGAVSGLVGDNENNAHRQHQGKAAPPSSGYGVPTFTKDSRLAVAPTFDPNVKRSKHDETAYIKEELEEARRRGDIPGLDK